MEEIVKRLTDKTQIPDEAVLQDFLGAKTFSLWKAFIGWIEEMYPGVFSTNDWRYGGIRGGWALRFKKSKAFCTLLPEAGGFSVVIVLSRAEMEIIESILNTLHPDIISAYRDATTYSEGKWLFIKVDVHKKFEDVKKLLEIKRKPKK